MRVNDQHDDDDDIYTDKCPRITEDARAISKRS